ncbi:glycerol-3-phosphate dehydrogenase [Aestuariispira ectoiniformans]|uniref:glycerol-3-phosphate dehydrogenase n=1 Tax=Aestuariispira ectoiniformans TaxID=2775080 RepID=UPI00223B7356|nr:glycerol-3-phosphate dehydrogenase [Aestuariispira ectoiniformans]
MAQEQPYDLAIIGGGINGAGIARDAAGRGLSVFLCEKNDLASATSSSSTKLIHGGLRYLEHYEFRLVREALKEREVLLRAAPHIIWPLRFVLPHVKGLRPAWLIRLGLFLYDNLGGREILPGSEGIRFANHPSGKPLTKDLKKGFVYSDCWVQDSRLTVLNAMDASRMGAEIHTREECIEARREGDLWLVRTRRQDNGEVSEIKARSLVNASGPWCAEIIEQTLSLHSKRQIRLVKGSHIVVPRLFEHNYCYIFQNPDGRIVFAIPYENDFTLVGTTDVDYQGNPSDTKISGEEVDYLCKLINQYFEKKITADDVVWNYSGVRPLYGEDSENASAVTRDYTLDLEGEGGEAPLLNIFGGKITTYRKLAEHAMQKLSGALHIPDKPWTAGAKLPGGDIGGVDFDGYVEQVKAKYPWLPSALAYRYARNYGTLLEKIVGGATNLEGLGECLGDDLFEAEVSYLISCEWARTAEDILWRRSKLGLHLSKSTINRLNAYMSAQNADVSKAVSKEKKVSS